MAKKEKPSNLTRKAEETRSGAKGEKAPPEIHQKHARRFRAQTCINFLFSANTPLPKNVVYNVRKKCQLNNKQSNKFLQYFEGVQN